MLSEDQEGYGQTAVGDQAAAGAGLEATGPAGVGETIRNPRSTAAKERCTSDHHYPIEPS